MMPCYLESSIFSITNLPEFVVAQNQENRNLMCLNVNLELQRQFDSPVRTQPEKIGNPISLENLDNMIIINNEASAKIIWMSADDSISLLNMKDLSKKNYEKFWKLPVKTKEQSYYGIDYSDKTKIMAGLSRGDKDNFFFHFLNTRTKDFQVKLASNLFSEGIFF